MVGGCRFSHPGSSDDVLLQLKRWCLIGRFYKTRAADKDTGHKFADLSKHAFMPESRLDDELIVDEADLEWILPSDAEDMGNADDENDEDDDGDLDDGIEEEEEEDDDDSGSSSSSSSGSTSSSS